MSEESAIDAIEEFVALAIERRRRPLSADDRERIEFLDELLREMIDGSRPAPRRIANPAPARGGPSPIAPAKIQTTTTAPSAPAVPSTPSVPSAPPPIQAPPGPLKPAAAPAKAAPAPAQPTAKMSGALDDVMKLSTADKKKVSEIRLEDLPKSFYTPPSIPAFMADYFSENMVPDRVTGHQVPTRVVNGDGEQVDLSKEMRVLLGLERGPAPGHSPPSPRPQGAAPSAPPPVSARAAAPAAPVVEEGLPVIVHLLQGGTRRGSIELFDPDGAGLEFTDGQTLPFKDVLAVFFGVKKGEPPSPGGGQPVVVKLVNDKQVSGLTNDYEEGAMALTVVPEPRRGNIDRIWVPAWAVKGIEI